MHYSTVTTMLLALIPAFALSLPTLAPRQELIGSAQLLWWSDTGLVSSFLSEATTLSPQDLATKAASALFFETDEKTHKASLDAIFQNVANPDAAVLAALAASKVLIDQGTFQIVVNGLNDLATNGAGYTPAQVAVAINGINTDRCNFVLPAIDAYLQAAAAVTGNTAASLAVRPNNCP